MRAVFKFAAQGGVKMSQILQVLVGARGVATGVQRVSPVRNASSFVDFNNNATLDAESQEADNRSLVDPVALALLDRRLVKPQRITIWVSLRSTAAMKPPLVRNLRVQLRYQARPRRLKNFSLYFAIQDAV